MDNILVVDDEQEVGNFLSFLLEEKGYRVSVAESGKQTLDLLNDHKFGLAMLDVRLPDANGLDLLKEIKQKLPLCKVIIMTGYSTVKTAVEAIKLGANDYIEKPFEDIDQLEVQIDALFNDKDYTENTIESLAHGVGFIIGKQAEMKHLVTLAYKIASKNVNVLIEGETGTGKEVLARFIHQASARRDQPFIGINCGALSHALLESELFGHEKGAFTGAVNQRSGIFEIASQGTLLLDEIAEMTPAVQVKLLRVLETREFMRVGGEKPLRTNTRILAASHANLGETVRQQQFREDLFYRLDVVKLQIPSLRERNKDIPLFVSYFLEKNSSSLTFSDEAMNLLKNYSWPGNVRELANTVTQLTTLMDGEKTTITPADLPEKIILGNEIQTREKNSSQPVQTTDDDTTDLKSFLNAWENHMIHSLEDLRNFDFNHIENQIKELEHRVETTFMKQALIEADGNRKEAAHLLNISQRKFRYLLNEKNKED
ncbi:sigma-54-dependent transcriptional regulator [Virgibacillus alimentarius]|uniref:sigma-54-dependent transcriptional regulator n=1 Tax=Virgibacillus alimentarius TaxID=698769 RepID=UPI000493A8E9|nr:sigma-54 dependent transcriptional regulator [Virgibacillus alimentarius]